MFVAIAAEVDEDVVTGAADDIMVAEGVSPMLGTGAAFATGGAMDALAL